jgi:hypothetical protein
MTKQKKVPDFNLEKALYKKIVVDKQALSEIEFNLCSEELKKTYIQTIAGKKLSGFEFKWCNQNDIDAKAIAKANLLKSGRHLSKDELKLFSKEEVGEYMESLLEKIEHIADYEIELISKERYQQWLHSLIEKKKWLPDEENDFSLLSDEYKTIYAKRCYDENGYDDEMLFEVFKWLGEEQKLIFVVNNGLSNMDSAYEKWFNSWKKGYDRQKQIDSVLI